MAKQKEVDLLATASCSMGFETFKLQTEEWDGHMHASLHWSCCQGHSFALSPHSVLKGGHWYMECIAPPWNYHFLARKNPFAAQVLKTN
jgi:hypothetical protein